MTELEKIEAEIKALESERTALFNKIRPLQDRVGELHDLIEPLQEERAKLVLASMKTPDWKRIVKDLASDVTGSRELLHYAEKHLREQFGMYHSGLWSDTSEANIHLMVARNDESEKKNLKGLQYFATILTPHKDGMVWFGLFEHTLSEHGSYCLKARPNLKNLSLVCTVYGRDREIKTFFTAKEAVRYIRDHHWYGDSETKEDDVDYQDPCAY
jgi:hypothetical protein